MAPAADSQAQVLSQWNAVYDAYNEVACLILGSMTHELHRQFENSSPYDMIKELKSMLKYKARVERFGTKYIFPMLATREGACLVKRDTPDQNSNKRSVKCIFIRYLKETMGYYFYFLPEKKIVVARYAEFFEKNLITQEVSGRAIDHEKNQDEDTSPSESLAIFHMEVEGLEPPQEDVLRFSRSERVNRAPDR
ncbi:hypothetical protein Tco_1218585 [Tanacetum coccineum]